MIFPLQGNIFPPGKRGEGTIFPSAQNKIKNTVLDNGRRCFNQLNCIVLILLFGVTKHDYIFVTIRRIHLYYFIIAIIIRFNYDLIIIIIISLL